MQTPLCAKSAIELSQKPRLKKTAKKKQMTLCPKSAIELSQKPIFDESRERNANAALRKKRDRTVAKNRI